MGAKMGAASIAVTDPEGRPCRHCPPKDFLVSSFIFYDLSEVSTPVTLRKTHP
jgi:hypothetical protein